MNVIGHLHVPAALLQGKSPLLLWYRGLGDPQSQSECCDKEKSELLIFTSGITSSLQYTYAAGTTTSWTCAEKG